MKAHPFFLARGNVRDDAKYGGVLIFSGGSLSSLPCTLAHFNCVGFTVQC